MSKIFKIHLDALLVFDKHVGAHLVVVLAFEKFLTEPNVEARVVRLFHVVAFLADAVHSSSWMINSTMVNTTTSCSTLKMW
jgi:hypothetical protein